MSLARSVARSFFATRQQVSLIRRRARAVGTHTASVVLNRASRMRSRVSLAGTVVSGLYDFYTKGNVSLEARRALLQLHCETNARFTDRLATVLRMVRPPRSPAPVSGVLGDLSIAQQQTIVSSISDNGYHIFEHSVPSHLCDDIEYFAAQTPAIVEGRGQAPENRVIFDAKSPISKTYRIPEEQVVSNRGIQFLMADESLLAIAELYLRTLPVLESVNMWWSPAFGDKPGGGAAQEFHFDFDPPPIWLHFFIYLTDVGPRNGPHVFVRRSHVAGNPGAGPLLTRGYVRIPDDDIARNFGPENIVELCGKRGTILAVVTRGFHKGKMPTLGHRLVAQLIFAFPPFSGAHGRHQHLPADIPPALAAAMSKAPRVYDKYRRATTMVRGERQ